MRTTTHQRLALIALVAGFATYATLFIGKTTFVFRGQTYFTLFDDMMVSMRYAKHLAAGDGLVWNLGERVEGFSNQLWGFYMALLHFLPLPLAKMSLLLQITGALLLLATAVRTWRLTRRLTEGAFFPAYLAAGLTLFYYPLVNWSLQGCEVSLLTFLTVWAVDATLATDRFTWRPYVLLGIATLTRLDGVVPFLAVLAYGLWRDRSERVRHIGAAATVLTLTLGGQTLARSLYYGDVLPNTYYLKLGEVPLWLRYKRGMNTLHGFVRGFNPVLIGLPWLGLLTNRGGEIALPLLVCAAQAAYNVFTGGDAWEWVGGSNRFLSVVVPLLFATLAFALHRIAHASVRYRSLPVAGRWGARFVVATAIAVTINAMWTPPTASDRPDTESSGRTGSLARWLLRTPPPDVARQHARNVLGLSLAEGTSPQAVVAVVFAGGMPYFVERTYVDLLGKCDAEIAHGPLHPRTAFWPGHVKWNYARSLAHYRPDIVVELWKFPEEAEPILARDYQRIDWRGFSFWMRIGSPYVWLTPGEPPSLFGQPVIPRTPGA